MPISLNIKLCLGRKLNSDCLPSLLIVQSRRHLWNHYSTKHTNISRILNFIEKLIFPSYQNYHEIVEICLDLTAGSWAKKSVVLWGPTVRVSQVQENTLTNIYKIRRSSHKSIVMTSFIFTKSSLKILLKVQPRPKSQFSWWVAFVYYMTFTLFEKMDPYNLYDINYIDGHFGLQKDVWDYKFSRENAQK